MATLTSADRDRVWRILMRYCSNLRETLSASKSLLLTLVGETDQWLEDNQASYNSALSANSLTAAQKTRLFAIVALMRSMGAAALRRTLGADTE